MFFNKRIPVNCLIFCMGVLMLQCILLHQPVALAENSGIYFASLQKRLIKDGFDKKTIHALYQSNTVSFETRGVSLFLVHREAALDYDQYASKKSIQDGLDYMEKYNSELVKTEAAYGVDKEVITAIILIESRLGNAVGGPSILNTLSTMAALGDPDIREIFWENVASSAEVSRKQFNKWAVKKSKWAYKELKAFLRYTAREKMDPTGISGSYAGALGVPQFMPSSILAYAKDGDSDGDIDLFNHADAIVSVANFLKRAGWHAGIDRETASHVIHRYNHSSQYVEAVLKVSALLKG